MDCTEGWHFCTSEAGLPSERLMFVAGEGGGGASKARVARARNSGSAGAAERCSPAGGAERTRSLAGRRRALPCPTHPPGCCRSSKGGARAAWCCRARKSRSRGSGGTPPSARASPLPCACTARPPLRDQRSRADEREGRSCVCWWMPTCSCISSLCTCTARPHLQGQTQGEGGHQGLFRVPVCNQEQCSAGAGQGAAGR